MTDEDSLAEWKLWLDERVDKGVKCPCCTQFAKRYKRPLHSGMARVLIEQWQAVGQEYAHTARLVPSLREGAKLNYWKLMEQDPEKRDDGGQSGFWRITDLGRFFVQNMVAVPKYAVVFDDHVLWHEGEHITIIDSLGTKFDYRELMST